MRKKKKPEKGICKKCGCTEEAACLPNGCFWITKKKDLCSACVPEIEWPEYLKELHRTPTRRNEMDFKEKDSHGDLMHKFSPDRFDDLAGGWNRDHFKKIDRGPYAPDELDWAKGDEYCKKEGLRLETLEEAESIIDRTRTAPAVLANYPGEVKLGWHWTQDPVVGYPDCAWVVSLHDGYVCYNHRNIRYYVRPVRAS